MADTEGRAYDAHDAQRDAPTGFRRRVNRRVTTYILMQRLGAKRLATPADQLAWRDLESFFHDKGTVQGHLTAAEQTIRWVTISPVRVLTQARLQLFAGLVAALRAWRARR